MKSIKEFEPLMGSWYVDRVLGEGTFGTVYMVHSDKTGIRETAVIKHISVPKNEAAYKNLRYELNTTNDIYIRAHVESSKDSVIAEYNLQSKFRGFTNFVDCQDIEIIQRDDPEFPGYDIFIRMEKLVNLAESTVGCRMTAEETAKLGIDVCRALELLKKENLVHRDLKPQNIFISKNGDYKVGDFGTARSLPSGSVMMSVTGTNGFMAPEIAKGEAAGYEADIYSLGIVMYRQLNGSAPFMEPGSISTTAQIAKAELSRLTGESIPDIAGAPDELNRIIKKACEYDKHNRYNDPAVMRKELKRFLATKRAVNFVDDEEEPVASLPEVPVKEVQAEAAPIHEVEQKTNEPVVSSERSEKVVLPEKTVKNEKAVAETEDIPVPKPVKETKPPKPENEKTTNETSNKPKKKLKLYAIFAAVLCVALIGVSGYLLLKPQFITSEMAACKRGEHTWSEATYTITKAATCKAAGEMQLTCSVCGNTETVPLPKDSTNHAGGTEIRNKKDATCTESGYTGDTYCKGCNQKIYTGSSVAVTGHKWKEATYEAPKACSVCGKTEGQPIPRLAVGDYITFGHYEQDNNLSNGKEPIEWIVLKYDSATNKALLLSRYGLDAHRFGASTYQGWANSEIHSWLNSTFLNAAFTAEERKAIATTTVKTGNNDEWVAFAKKKGWSYDNVSGRADTQDKVFLLSLEEAMAYGGYSTLADFYNNGTDKMKAVPTKYAVAQGAYQSSSNKLDGTGCCWWWLRSPGPRWSIASNVDSDGSLTNRGVAGTSGSVRPAFWLNLDSIIP